MQMTQYFWKFFLILCIHMHFRNKWFVNDVCFLNPRSKKRRYARPSVRSFYRPNKICLSHSSQELLINFWCATWLMVDCIHLQHKFLFTDLVYFFNTYHRIWSFSSELFTDWIHPLELLLVITYRVCQFHTNTAPTCTFFLPTWLISIVLSHYSKWI